MSGRWRISAPVLAALLLLLGPGCSSDRRGRLGPAGQGQADHGDLPTPGTVVPVRYANGFAAAEGPAFDRHGNLYVVNFQRLGTIGRTTPDGTTSMFVDLRDPSVPGHHSRSQANGLKVDREGWLVATDPGAKRLIRIRPDGKLITVLADKDAEGEPFFGPNDCALDRFGDVYFTDPTGSNEKNPVGRIYRYDQSTGNVTRLASGLRFPNGLGVTPDGKHLCVSESRGFRMLIFDIRPDRTLANQRVLTQFATHNGDATLGSAGEPDGLVFDDQGRLYVPMWVGAVVNVIEVPSGRIIRTYDAGGSQATNVHFYGGDLYVTVAAEKAVFKLPLGVEGYDYNREP